LRERLLVFERAAQEFDMQRFSLKKLSEVEVGENHKLKVSNRSAALENLHDSWDISMAWENIGENVK
jgi:hypothetical protein